VKKIIGVASIFLGILGLFVLLVDFNVLSIISSGILILLGRNLINSNKTRDPKPIKKKDINAATEPVQKVKKTPKPNHINFNVVGISKNNDVGQDIQSLIKDFVKEEIEMGNVDAYEGLTNKEILMDDLEVYEVDIYGDYEIELVPEPDNLFDPEAIKVIHDEIGHLGYVPREMTSRVSEAIENDADLEWKLVGGKIKYADLESDKVRTKTLNYGVSIDLYY
jgi:hypothetical protein